MRREKEREKEREEKEGERGERRRGGERLQHRETANECGRNNLEPNNCTSSKRIKTEDHMPQIRRNTERISHWCDPRTTGNHADMLRIPLFDTF